MTYSDELILLRAGARAFHDGRPSTSCPLPVPGPAAGVWLAGWVAARTAAAPAPPTPLH